MSPALSLDRPALVRRSRRLNYATLAYNSLEGLIALGAGFLAGSVALVGFGVDSLIELTASGTALWRLQADANPRHRQWAEDRSLRVVGLLFLALALYVAIDAARTLATGQAPERSCIGIILATVSLVVMPMLAQAKKSVAMQLQSGALAAEAKQTLICTYLSALLLGGLGLNALAGWWWADPIAALAMVPLIAREGIAGLRGRAFCADERGPVSGAA